MAEPGAPGEGRMPGGPSPDEGSFAEERFLAELTGWAAGQRVAGAAAARSRMRALAESAAGAATLTGVLVDLAERRAEVTVTTWPPLQAPAAGRLSGRLVGVGRDFCVLEPPGRPPLLIHLDALASVAPAPEPGRPPSGPGPAGDRAAPLALSLLGVLAELAVERTPICVAGSGERVEGVLIGAGEDVITIEVSRAPRRAVHVPATAVRWCELR